MLTKYSHSGSAASASCISASVRSTTVTPAQLTLMMMGPSIEVEEDCKLPPIVKE